MQFTNFQILEENVSNCTFYYIPSLKRKTWLLEGFLKIGIPHGTRRSPSYFCLSLVTIPNKRPCSHLLPLPVFSPQDISSCCNHSFQFWTIKVSYSFKQPFQKTNWPKLIILYFTFFPPSWQSFKPGSLLFLKKILCRKLFFNAAASVRHILVLSFILIPHVRSQSPSHDPYRPGFLSIGQRWSLQSSMLYDAPYLKQLLPSPLGFGFVQFLTFTLLPPPQVFEHEDQLDQLEYPPFWESTMSFTVS